MILARVPVEQAEEFSAWRFYSEGKWVDDYRQASRMVSDMASECSVSFVPQLNAYVLIYSERGLSPRILARTAPTPWGPWSSARVVYRCPEADWDRKIFCYGAKAHPHLSSDQELAVSYVANSFEFWQVAADARLYWPRFVRLPLASLR